MLNRPWPLRCEFRQPSGFVLRGALARAQYHLQSACEVQQAVQVRAFFLTGFTESALGPEVRPEILIPHNVRLFPSCA